MSKVFIQATCRNQALWDATTLVFKTLRTGFPTADIHVAPNGMRLSGSQIVELADLVFKIDGKQPLLYAQPNPQTTYQDWVCSLIEDENKPFWICDTDMIFYGNMERFEERFVCPMAGRHTPQFRCPYTRLRTYQRLHTSLLWIDPAAVRDGAERLRESLVQTPFESYRVDLKTLVSPDVTFHHTERFFHDCCSKLCALVPNKGFTNEMLDTYTHLNCGTYSDLVDPSGGMTERNRRRMADPESARGLWREQEEWYAARRW